MSITGRYLVASALVLGAAALTARAGTLTATFTTTPNGGPYAPRHVVAVWVEGPGTTFVKTIGRWSAARTSTLVGWRAKAGNADVDAVSGATIATHTAPLTVTWDLKDRNNADIADGTYTLRMELADSNASTAAQNHQGTFTFAKSGAAQTQSALANGGFTDVSITMDPGAVPVPPPDPLPDAGAGSGGDDAGVYESAPIEGGCVVGAGGLGSAPLAVLGCVALALRRRSRRSAMRA
ncbi:hypothetical protein BH11MYX2_BH11MYX2_28230 [soil metagenome]